MQRGSASRERKGLSNADLRVVGLVLPQFVPLQERFLRIQLEIVKQAWLALVILSGTAWANIPSYSAAGIVNASNYAPGPFAPNSIVSIFGTNLALSTQAAP